MCPTLKRNPGKEDRKAPFQALKCNTEFKLLPVKFCPVMAAVRRVTEQIPEPLTPLPLIASLFTVARAS